YDRPASYQSAKDLFGRYTNLSSRIHVEYVDPDKKPEEARAAGITNYGTTIVQVGTKKEEAKSLTEEQLTGALIRDLKNRTRTVCFVSGSGEHQIENGDEREGYSKFKDSLAKDEYATKSISLIEKPEIPADCTVVLIGGPKSDYLQPAVDAIKKYVEDGGRA